MQLVVSSFPNGGSTELLFLSSKYSTTDAKKAVVCTMLSEG